MALFVYAAPGSEPITLEEAKDHLRVEVDDDNELIDQLIQAAREHVETHTHRALINRTYDYKLDCFPCDGPIWLPNPPLSSVSSVTYTATDGTATVWSSALYTVDAPSDPQARPGRLMPAYQEIYPVTRAVENAVTIRYVAGYGGAEDIPASIKSAIKILIGTWYDPGRQAVQIGNLVSVIPQTVDALLWPFKSF